MPETNGGFVCAASAATYIFQFYRRYAAEEPRCGMQKHAGAVNLFTKRFLIETLCAIPPASAVPEVSFPAVRIVGTKFLNAARDRAEI